jgi:hypothetical protein
VMSNAAAIRIATGACTDPVVVFFMRVTMYRHARRRQ